MIFEAVYNKAYLKLINKKIYKVKSYISQYEGIESCELNRKFSCEELDVCQSLALVTVMVQRIFNLTVFHQQLQCSLLILENNAVEMGTGEGKSISILLSSCVFVKQKRKVHIVTVNDYLVKRDHDKNKPVYEALGVSCAYKLETSVYNPEMYNSDVVFSSSNGLMFDYLYESLDVLNDAGIKRDVVIIDELDYVLLDNALSQCSVSDGSNLLNTKNIEFLYSELSQCIDKLQGCILTEEISADLDKLLLKHDYILVESQREVYVSERAYDKVNSLLLEVYGITTIFSCLYFLLKAYKVYKKGYDYTVMNNKVVLMNRANGRPLYNSRLEYEMQLALEVKENAEISFYSSISNSISYQVFYSKYKDILGVSGTLVAARQELSLLYGIPVIKISPRLKIKRKRLPWIVYKDSAERDAALLRDLKQLSGCPVLIFFEDEQQLKKYSGYLNSNGIEHSNFTSENLQDEEILIDKLRTESIIVLTTQLMGRGTDIIVDTEKFMNGLAVLLYTKFKSIRIEGQLIGRCARIGQPGITKQYISLEDDIFNRIPVNVLEEYKKLEGVEYYNPYIIGKLKKKLNRLQKSYDNEYFRMRLLSVEYDSIVDTQKQAIYNRYREVIRSDDLLSVFKKVMFNHWFMEDSSKYFECLSKISMYGEEVSTSLIKELIGMVVREEWNIYKENLEPLRMEALYEIIYGKKFGQEFILKSHSCYNDMIENINLAVMDLFNRSQIAS